MKESPSHEKILQELVMDILRVLSSPDLEVRKKTLALAMDLVTSRNIDELVLVLKKVRMVVKINPEIINATFNIFFSQQCLNMRKYDAEIKIINPFFWVKKVEN